LDAIDALIAHPDWRPGMPVIEDLREASSTPPANCETEWRAYVAARGPLLGGCRWAVVMEARHAPLTPVLETAAGDATGALTLQRFSNMVDAHDWVMGSSLNKIEAHGCWRCCVHSRWRESLGEQIETLRTLRTNGRGSRLEHHARQAPPSDSGHAARQT
jgi:hypothetical protein